MADPVWTKLAPTAVGGASSLGTITLTLNRDQDAGTILVVDSVANTATGATVTDSRGGNTWQSDLAVTGHNRCPFSSSCKAANLLKSGDVVTVTFNTSVTDRNAVIYQVTNLDQTTWTAGSIGSFSGSGTTTDSTLLTGLTSGNHYGVHGVCGYNNAGSTYTAGNDGNGDALTLLDMTSSGSSFRMATEAGLSVTGHTSYKATGTITSAAWVQGVVVYNIAAGVTNITITPPAASASASSSTPGPQLSVTTSTASASAAAVAPTARLQVAPAAASAPASAVAPVPRLSIAPSAAAASASGVAPTVALRIAPSAAAASASATASVALSLAPPVASATASAPVPVPTFSLAPPAAAAAASASAPIPGVAILPPAASAPASASVPTVGIQLAPPAAQATAHAIPPVVTFAPAAPPSTDFFDPPSPTDAAYAVGLTASTFSPATPGSAAYGTDGPETASYDPASPRTVRT